MGLIIEWKKIFYESTPTVQRRINNARAWLLGPIGDLMLNTSSKTFEPAWKVTKSKPNKKVPTETVHIVNF